MPVEQEKKRPPAVVNRENGKDVSSCEEEIEKENPPFACNGFGKIAAFHLFRFLWSENERKKKEN